MELLSIGTLYLWQIASGCAEWILRACVFFFPPLFAMNLFENFGILQYIPANSEEFSFLLFTTADGATSELRFSRTWPSPVGLV